MNKKILIVRGDRQNAKALSFLLAGSGYQISSHATAGEAVEAARHQRFDLAITDESVPENHPDLGFVANLKEAQPSLPVFLITQQQSLETVISCIRAGVTEVLGDPADLRSVIETTNAFLRHAATGDEVTWEDIVEVERMLEATLENGSGGHGGENAPSTPDGRALKQKLDEALAERDRISGELARTLSNLEKSRKLVEELKAESGNQSTGTEVAERAAELDERELKLKELSSKISLQKVEVESQLGELEAQRIEFEEMQKDAPANLSGEFFSEELETERAKFAADRAELESRIQELEKALVDAREGAAGIEELEAQMERLRDELQDNKEAISEKDFIIQQRDREIEALRSDSENNADPIEVEELREEKRLLEIERHRLKEKVDQFEIEKRMAEESHTKRQREIQVERRDAEVSLREMQNTIKEEQLKLKVEQATLKEEMRQFEQARQNFQEDVQELQSKQAELRKMEAYLQQMEKTIQENGISAGNALPKPDLSALDPLEPTTPSSPLFETSEPSEAESKAAAPKEKPNDKPEQPDTWSKPNMEKKAGRGPLRIGRRSSF